MSTIQDFLTFNQTLCKSCRISLKKFCNVPHILGYTMAVVASLLAGMADVIPKPLLGDNTTPDSTFINPILFVFLIYIINSIFFTGISKKSNTPITKLKRKTILLIMLIGIAEAAGTIAYYTGLKETTAINASILGNGETIFAILIALIIFREKLQRKELFPFILIIVGAALIPTLSDLDDTMMLSALVFGDVLVLVSGIFYAFDVIISKFVCHKVDSKRIMQIASISAAFFTIVTLIILQIPVEIDFSQLPTVAITGIFGMGLSSVFFIIALKIIGAVRAVLIYSTTAVFGLVFATFYLGETITLTNLASVIVVLVGLYLLRTKLGQDE